jgi:hypothetical protein
MIWSGVSWTTAELTDISTMVEQYFRPWFNIFLPATTSNDRTAKDTDCICELILLAANYWLSSDKTNGVSLHLRLGNNSTSPKLGEVLKVLCVRAFPPTQFTRLAKLAQLHFIASMLFFVRT